MDARSFEEHPSVSLFREYIRINTSHPKPDYDSTVTFLKRIAEKYGLEFKVYELVQKKPIVLMTWRGSDPSLQSILLNSHTDVVPADESMWKYHPFEAYKDEEGNIYGRGTQDMKCVGIQHLEAVHRLKESGFVPRRSVHLSFVPDEEIGGICGMQKFVETEDFAKLNVGFGLDEGLATESNVLPAYYAERSAWWVQVTARGETGHGSRLFEGTAIMRLLSFLKYYLEWRESELNRYVSQNLDIGEVSTVNLNMIKSGAFSNDSKNWQINIIPGKAECALDMRLSPDVDLKEFEARILRSAKELGVEIEFVQVFRENPVSIVDRSKSKWWDTLLNVCEKYNFDVKPRICPASSDSRFLRRKGIQVIGISPIINTKILLHDNNEFLNENVFLNGINFFTTLVEGLLQV